jgi:site-specific recombinase XerD
MTLEQTGTEHGTVEDARVAAIRHATIGWLLRQRSPQTRVAYDRAIQQWVGFATTYSVDPVNPGRQDIGAWIAWSRQQGHSPATIKQRAAAIRGWHRELMLEGLRPNTDPWIGVTLPAVAGQAPVRQLTDEQVRALLVAARTMSSPAETAIAMMASMGMRASETGTATGAQVQPTPWGDCLAVVGKGEKRALLPITEVVAQAAARVGWPGDDLSEYIPAIPDRARKRVWAWVGAVGKRAGVPCNPHALRHWFVTAGLREGVPLHVMQDSARHSDPSTTQRYNRLRDQIADHAAHTVGALLL